MDVNPDILNHPTKRHFEFVDCEKRASRRCACACCDRKALMKCLCNERVIYLNRGEIIMKSRLIKVNSGVTLAKCKRCGNWIEVPFLMSGELM